MSGASIKLDGHEPFGVGGRRACYVHPEDPSRCIKVLRQDDRRTIRGANSGFVPASMRRAYDNNAHELDILDRLYKRLGPDMCSHLPRSYGMTDTDLGPGLVLDLVRGSDGRIARSIREWITVGKDLNVLRPAFQELGHFLLEHRVLTRNLLDHNIVIKSHDDKTYQLYIIDGFGDPAWLPIARWVAPIGRAKVRRRIKAAWPRFEAFAKTGGVTDEMRRNSSWDQGILRHRD